MQSREEPAYLWIGGFVTALISIPAAGALQILVRELWQSTAPDGPPDGEPTSPTGIEADHSAGRGRSTLRSGVLIPIAADNITRATIAFTIAGLPGGLAVSGKPPPHPS